MDPDALPASEGLPGMLGVDHVGLAVADLDAAIRFQAETFGLVVQHREVNEAQGVAEAMLGSPDAEAGATVVQLVAPLDDRSPLRRFLDRSGPGLQHLAYRVADLDVASAHLRRRGLRLIYDRAQAGTRGSRINFVHPKDAGGVLVELVEPAAVAEEPALGGEAGWGPTARN